MCPMQFIETTSTKRKKRKYMKHLNSHVSSYIFKYEDKHNRITVDSYSGWYEIDYLKDIWIVTVIAKLNKIFSTHGSPYKLTTDKGRQYTSEQFQQFVCDWDIRHITSSPAYPQSNGLAERVVRSDKELLEKCHRDKSHIFLVLLHTRNTTKCKLSSPAQKLMSRRLRSTIPMTEEILKPAVQINVYKTLVKKRQQNKTHYYKSAKNLPDLQQGDTVRLQTSGHDKIGRIEGPTSDPPIPLYQEVFIIVEIVGSYSKCLKHIMMMMMYCTNKAPVTNEHVNQNPNPVKSHSRFGRVYKPNPKYND